MAHFNLSFLQKMVLGAWGYKAIKQVVEERSPEKQINTGRYTLVQAKFIVQTAMTSHNYINWHRYMEQEAGLNTNEIITTIVNYTPEQFFYYFSIVKPL